jgi:hypothetical protein
MPLSLAPADWRDRKLPMGGALVAPVRTALCLIWVNIYLTFIGKCFNSTF